MRSAALLVALAVSAHAHFVLQIPAGLGYDDAQETTGPCDTFDPTNRDAVSNFAVGGDSIGLLTTHPSVEWEINVALVSDLKWIPLVQPFKQTAGVGEVCFQAIPGFSAWIGKPVVIQLIQHASDGQLYQCAAINFVAGGPASVPSGCTNSAGVAVDQIIPASPPSGGTSSLPPPPSSTSSIESSSPSSSPTSPPSSSPTSPPYSSLETSSATVSTSTSPTSITAGSGSSTTSGTTQHSSSKTVVGTGGLKSTTTSSLATFTAGAARNILAVAGGLVPVVVALAL